MEVIQLIIYAKKWQKCWSYIPAHISMYTYFYRITLHAESGPKTQ